MDLILTCLNVSFSLPVIPIINNVTNVQNHSHYNPNGKAIFQLISSKLTSSIFSMTDVQSLLTLVTSNKTQSWDVSTIVALKPVTSSIVYASVALVIFMSLSLIFCIVSRQNCCKASSYQVGI